MPIYSGEEYDELYGHKVKTYPLPTDCATSNYPRVIHSEETWRFLQYVFYEQGYSRKSYHHRMMERYNNVWYSGIDDYYVEARDNGDGRGRGVYAKRDIPEGTKLWSNSLEWVMNDGYWDSKEKMINFLSRLPHDLQCDVTLWAFATTFKRNNQIQKSVDCNLDEASYFNHAEREDLVNFHAIRSLTLRDIEEGEELLMDYGLFIALGEDSIPWWDEIRNTAWQANEYKEIETDLDVANSSESSIGSSPQYDAIDGYVKYGAPTSMSKTAATNSVYVDDHSTSSLDATSYVLLSILAGVPLAWVFMRIVAMMGLRRKS